MNESTRENIKETINAEEVLVVNNERGRRNDYFLPVSILVAGIMVSASIIYLVGSKNTQPQAANVGGIAAPAAVGGTPQISSRDVILGNPKAPVTLIEYGDYQCPFCGKFFTQVEPLLRDEYIKTGKVKMIFKDFSFLGPESFAAAEAAECAKDQSKFWEYHDALYAAEIADGQENSGNINRTLLVKLAGDVKMDTNAFANCIDAKKYAAQVQQNAADGQAVGVNSTPTTFVNGQKLQGALPYAQFKAAIDGILNSK